MKRFLAFAMAVLMLALTLASCDVALPENSGSSSSSSSTNASEVKGQVPVYQGVTIANTKPTETLRSSGFIYLAGDDKINQLDPFGKGDNGKHLGQLLKNKFPAVDSVEDEYYARKNSDVYILVHIDNPNDYIIQSFTLNGKVYASYMFEDGSDMELLILKYNVGDVTETQEYTIDAIKYIDGKQIKNVDMKGEKTVKVNITPEEQPTAAITYKGAGKVDIDITDGLGLIEKSEGELLLVVYDGEELLTTKPLNVGNNSNVTIDKLSNGKTYQLAVVAVYDALDGEAKTAHILATYAFKITYTWTAGAPIYWEEIYFDGEVLNVIARDDFKVSKEWEQEDLNDVDGLAAQVDIRNQVVEGDLGLDVRFTFIGDQWADTYVNEILSAVRNDVDQGMNAFDIVASYGFLSMSNAHRDLWVNLLDKDIFPCFDFSLPCWNQALVNNGTVNGRLYTCAGDMNLSLFDSAMILWHNKDLYEKLLVATNDTDSPKDIQDTVIAGEWTYSELYKWASYHADLDPEGNKGDIYGLYLNGIMWQAQPFDAIPYAWDLEFIKTNSDGTHDYSYIGNTRAEDALTKFRALWSEEGVAHEHTGGPSFTSGNLLFQGSVIWLSEADNLALRGMKDRYSILPWPKLDETQDHYTSTSQDYFTTMCVIDHSASGVPTKGDAISAYLQYGTEYSYTNVRMFYFKEIVEPKKYFGQFPDGTTKKSVVIFSTIINNLEYDFGTIYNSALGSVVTQCWRMNILSKYDDVNDKVGTLTVQQKFEQDQGRYEDALVELDRWFGLIEE